GDAALIALAGPANKQGRIAADNICGIPRAFKGSQGSSVMKLFDGTVASTGLTCEAAEAAGLGFDYVLLAPANHATYYPGSSSMTLKVVFERSSGRILGAQAVGREGVEKRIDVIATAMRARMTASDLTELDLCYAPPYSSAKDPVNMAGYIIENVLEGRVRQVTWDDVAAVAEKGIRDADEAESPRPPLVLLDCRTDGEFARSHIEGALHIPLDDLRDRLDLLSPDWEIWVYCQSGLRSYVACRILEQHGFSCANIAGGYGFYEQTALDRSVRTDGVGPCGMAAE
ncbi:MAG TPA: CoA-disulfide reductase, partial [Slackia equolifaciens]|nr:CoA-disulfide reductase [Slackia equolifaciens]